jgi:hypothetical protein
MVVPRWSILCFLEEPTMSSPRGSVTHWLGQLKAADHAAAQKLSERYFHRLVGPAGKILPRQVRRAADEAHATVSAFASSCRCAALGRYP